MNAKKLNFKLLTSYLNSSFHVVQPGLRDYSVLINKRLESYSLSQQY